MPSVAGQPAPFIGGMGFCPVVVTINSSTSNGRAAAVSSFSTPTRVGSSFQGDQQFSMVQSTSPDSVAMMHFDVDLNRRNNYEPSQSFYSAAGNVGHRPTHSPPESTKLYKTEMCRNIRDNGGFCKFGDACHYAHSEEERRPRDKEELMKDDQYTRPCCIMLETGYW